MKLRYFSSHKSYVNEALLCFVTYYNFLVQNVHKEFNTHKHTHVQGRVVDGSNSHKKSVIKKQLRDTYTPTGIADSAFANK